jgi:hypothetical protein
MQQLIIYILENTNNYSEKLKIWPVNYTKKKANYWILLKVSF